MRSVFVYRPENEEVIRTVSFMLEDLRVSNRVEGDCDDAAVFLAALLTARGIPSRFVAIRFGGVPTFRHVFVEWWEGSQWARLDVTVAPGVIHQEDERMVLNVV